MRKLKPSTAAAIAGSSAFAAAAAKTWIRSFGARPLSLNRKVVLITGGSRGLGFALAKDFGSRGARLALCARDSGELDRACRLLASEGVECAAFPCDITDRTAIEPLIHSVLARFGEIDVLVNDAGSIQVGPYENFELADYERTMDLMFWAPVQLTFALLPHMRNRGSGAIVNITSVGGRVSIPHLLPYSCAKFAFVAFSTGLASELRQHSVNVLTVVPGLMRTGSYLNAKFKGQQTREFALFSLLGNTPGFSVAAEYAARTIRRALENRRLTCTISLPAKLLIALEALLPETTRSMMALSTGFLPEPSEDNNWADGKALNAKFPAIFHALTKLGRSTATRLNET